MTAYMEFGIDLGTTNSCIAKVEGDTIRIFQSNDMMNVTPSAVRLLKNGRLIVGRRAYNAVLDDPANVAVEFKRSMGERTKISFPATGRELAPEELSAEVLKALRDDAQRATGLSLRAAVVTVPAAFGSLQCEATARAARLAGIEQSTLLQEPIAAALAYGAKPGVSDQRWLIYDLGGGTLDIAVISTRGGQLTVLEHRGNNLLGGKDIDRKLVEKLLLPSLADAFNVPDAAADTAAYQLLLRRLATKAEEVKIELSTRDQVMVSLFEIGEDSDGTPYELDLTVTRAQLEQIVAPIVQGTLRLAEEALAGARIAGTDLARVVLVGGPTQMPYIREALARHLQAPVDYSIDPMTVVACGAALFAATVEMAATTAATTAPMPGTIAVKFAFDPVSSTLEAPIAGKIQDGRCAKLEVRIDSQTGYWTSGWMPLVNGYFEVKAMLEEGKVCLFFVYMRDESGRTVNPEPNEIIIRHGLPMGAPPLPHTISIEVVRPSGVIELDPIFPRNTALPAERRVVYRADKTMRPGQPGAGINIKLWEGEDLREPESNEWIGNAQFSSDMISRPIPENSEIELFIRIDASRLITIEAYVPHLNQHFSQGVYMPEREQHDDRTTDAKIMREIEALVDRLSVVREHIDSSQNPGFATAFETMKRDVEDLDIDFSASCRRDGSFDREQARRIEATARNLRARVARLELQIGSDKLITTRATQAKRTLEEATETVAKYGDKVDRYECDMLRKAFEQAAERLDEPGVRKCIRQLDALSERVLWAQDWWCRDFFERIDKSDGSFINHSAARQWVAQGEAAIRNGEGDKLRQAINGLWALMPVSAAEASRRKAMRTTLRA